MAPGIPAERQAPVVNVNVENFVRDKHFQEHKRKVSKTRTLIDNTWSEREEQRLQTSRRNGKREQIMEDRCHGIEKENLRLLMRMQEIERRGSSARAAGAMLVGCSGRSSSVPTNPSVTGGPGSRVSARVKELRRIDAENLRLLRRLQGAKSSINMPHLLESHKEQQRVMRLRCEHQHPEWKEDMLKSQHKMQLCARGQRLAEVSPEEADVHRIALMQERLRYKAEEDETDLLDDEVDVLTQVILRRGSQRRETEIPPIAAEGSGAAPEGESPSGVPKFAGVIPKRSRALAEELLAEHLWEAEEVKDTEAEATAAKEAAAAAMREVAAFDSCSELLGYGDVVQRNKWRVNGVK